MDISKMIQLGFEKYVKSSITKEEIRRFLLNHERRKLLEQNLCKEIIKSFHYISDRESLQKIIEDYSKSFCITALEVKEAEFTSKKVTIEESQRQEEQSCLDL